MDGEVLGMFERAFVLEIGGDAGRAEDVITDPGLDTGVGRAPLNYAVSILLPRGVSRELTS